MSQQQFSYFDPEQETVYEPRYINRDPRELPEGRQAQEQTVYYVTPEQSMLKGEKLIPMQKVRPHANWVVAAIFLLMILFGTLIWTHEVLPSSGPLPYPPGKHGPIFDKPHEYGPPFKHEGDGEPDNR